MNTRVLWVFPLLLLALASRVEAQECRDRDGDGAGIEEVCPLPLDCEDRSWLRHPGATEICDGFDNDCDGTLDEGCPTWCGRPFLKPLKYELKSAPALNNTDAGVALADNGLIVGFQTLNAEGRPVAYAAGFDRLARSLDAASMLGDPQRPAPYDQLVQVGEAGDRMLFVWVDSSNLDFPLLNARVTDRLGRPISPVLDLAPSIPYGVWDWDYRPVWNGQRFAVFWTPAADYLRKKLYVSFVDAEGTTMPPVLVTSNMDGQGSTLNQMSAIWAGDHYLFAVALDVQPSGNPNLFVLPVNADGTMRGPAVPVGVYAGDPQMIQTGDQILLTWLVDMPFVSKIQFAFLNPEGQVLNPPGIVTLPPPQERVSRFSSSWTGAMAGVLASTMSWGGSEYNYKWWLWRIRPDGTIVAPSPTQLSDSKTLSDVVGLIWAGEEFWAVGKMKTKSILRFRIACSCGDADGDTFNACGGGDCDDSDPASHPGAVEICRGGRDENCNGFVDCDDSACLSGPGPGNVTGLRWDSGSLLWELTPGTQVYDLSRGLWSEAIRRGDLKAAECPGPSLRVTAWNDDGRRPPAGDVLWYLVRAEGEPCHPGSWGSTLAVGGCR